MIRSSPWAKDFDRCGILTGRKATPTVEAKTIPSPSEPTPSQEELALVRDMLAGSETAMEEFADGYFPSLYRFALARLSGRSELARDLVQTTVCKALQKLHSFRGEAPLFSWLCACCRNEIAMHFRNSHHRPQIVALEETGAESSPSAQLGRDREAPDRALLRREEKHRVHHALDLLPARYARVLEWKYLHRLPVKAIAQRLELSPKAAESLLTRARQAFRERYESLDRVPDNVRPLIRTGVEP